MLGVYVQATCRTGKPAMEAKWVARVAVAIQCLSGGTLSSAAGENINLLSVPVAARAATSEVFWTCFLEVVGAICSVFLACYGGGV